MRTAQTMQSHYVVTAAAVSARSCGCSINRVLVTRGRVRAGPSFQLGTLSTRIANLLGACDFRDSTKVPVSRDLWPWAHPGCRLTWGPSCASLVTIRWLPASALGIIARTDRQTRLTTSHSSRTQLKAGSFLLEIVCSCWGVYIWCAIYNRPDSYKEY